MGTVFFIVTASFLASAVEAVEALTIVLAVGLTNGWRTAFAGAASGLLTLTVVVIIVGPALVTLVPLSALQVVIGVLLLIFGLQWVRKAILRSSGLKAMHDEAAIFNEELSELRGAAATPTKSDIDWNGFVVSYKGVFLEGLEVAFIVLTFGANRGGEFGWSAVGALLACAVVIAAGALVHKPLTRVPENSIKFVVGLLLVSFGTFWGGEGIGIEWKLQDAMIPLLALIYAGAAFAIVAWLKRGAPVALAAAEGERELKYVIGFGKFWYDFIVGDSAILAIGGVGVLVLGSLLVRAGNAGIAEVAIPALVLATLVASTVPLRR